MSKDLKKEYRQMMQDMTPDLWEQISAGVDQSPRANGVITFEPTSTGRKQRKRIGKGRNHYQIQALVGVAACFLLLLVAIPTIRNSMLHRESEEYKGTIVLQDQSEDADYEASEDSFEVADFSEASAEECEAAEAPMEECVPVAAEQKAQASNSDAAAETAALAPALTAEADASPVAAEGLAEAEMAEEVAPVAEASEASAENAEVAEEIKEEASDEASARSRDSSDKKATKNSDTIDNKNTMDSATSDKKSAKDSETSDKRTASDTSLNVKTASVPKVNSVGVHSTTKTSNTTTASVSDNKAVAFYEGVTLKIQSTRNDDGTILYTAVVTSKGGALAEGSVHLLEIRNPAVGKLAEQKEYKVSMKDEGNTSTGGMAVLTVTSITEVPAETVDASVKN